MSHKKPGYRFENDSRARLNFTRVIGTALLHTRVLFSASSDCNWGCSNFRTVVLNTEIIPLCYTLLFD